MVYSPLVKTYIHHRIQYIDIYVYSNGEYTIYQLAKYLYIYTVFYEMVFKLDIYICLDCIWYGIMVWTYYGIDDRIPYIHIYIHNIVHGFCNPYIHRIIPYIYI